MFILFFEVPLGSIRELPAMSCQEIKASEGEGTISDNYWLDLADTGLPYLAYCNMTSAGESRLATLNPFAIERFHQNNKIVLRASKTSTNSEIVE